MHNILFSLNRCPPRNPRLIIARICVNLRNLRIRTMLILQNKANLLDAQMFVSDFLSSCYENFYRFGICKNKANQTQFYPPNCPVRQVGGQSQFWPFFSIRKLYMALLFGVSCLIDRRSVKIEWQRLFLNQGFY